MHKPIHIVFIASYSLGLILFFTSSLHAQNLVPNPSFEDPPVCPTTWGQIELADPWDSPTFATPDYYHECSTPGNYGVPQNNAGYQSARTGQGYAGLILAASPPDLFFREYIITELTEPLIEGIPYEVSFWVSLCDTYCATTEIGAYFSVEPPSTPHPTFEGRLEYIPQIKSTAGLLSDTQNWVLIHGCFIPQGGEQYVTIGNFSSFEDTPLVGECSWPEGYAYYYIEDVSVSQEGNIETIDLELGDPVLACDEFLIDPGIPDVNYYWSTGDNDSTLTVNETGTYALTVSAGCSVGYDSIDVTIHGLASVDIGPDSIVICEGETYGISLDPVLNSYVWQDGSTEPGIVITETGLYQVTMNDGCEATTDDVYVTVLSPPLPFAINADQVLCQDEEIALLFDPGLGNFMWQDGNDNSEYYIYDPGTYALTISNMCGEESASVVIELLALPTFSLGPDTIFLCNGQVYTIEIDLDPEIHDFEWSDNSNEPDYSINASGVYSVTVANECASIIDSISAFFQVGPVVDLGQDTILCDGQPFVIDAGMAEGTIYVWQDSSTLPVFHVTQDGNYFVQVANYCGTDTDTIQVDYVDSPVAFTLGPDISFCPGESIVLQLSDPNASFIWQDGSTHDSLLVNTAGEYHVTAFNSCGETSDTIVVSVNALPPDVDLPAVDTLCQGQTISLNAGINGVSYVWNDNSTGSTLDITSAGSYSITVSNSCGSDTDSIIIADGGPAPQVDLGNDLSLCPEETHTLTPIFSNVESWLWNSGESTPSIIITSAGETTVIATNGCGTVYDTLITTLLPAVPVFYLGNDTAICPGEIITLSITAPDVAITWSDGSTNDELIASAPGQYFATIANACGEYADTMQITPLPAIPLLNLGSDQSLCPGELIVIDPGIQNVDYLWQDGSTGPAFSTTQAISISLTISNECGSSTDQMEITESTEGPQVELGNDIVGCEAEEVTIQSGISGVDYLWQDGSTQSSFTTNISGEIIVNVSNNCGTDADTILVDLSGVAPTVNLGADTLLCDDASLNLAIITQPGTFINWQDGSSTPSFEVNTAGNYFVVVTNDCGEATDTIAVTYASTPQPFSLGPDTVLCAGETIVLTAPVTTDVIQWQDGSSANTFIADQSQLYSLQISNQCGIALDEMQLTLLDELFSIHLDPLIYWCPERTLNIDVEQPFPATYQWNTGATTPTISITSPGTYAISIQTSCATSSESFEVILDDACFSKTIYFIPNIFSPNGDGINDLFTVHFNADAELLSMEGSVYDRWGNIVFTSTDNPFTWNGKRKDQGMNPGVYVYAFTFTFLRNGVVTEEKVTGDVTLIR